MESLSYHGFTVANILADGKFQSLERDLDVVELFAGVASIHGAAQGAGVASAAYDIIRDPGRSDSQGEDSEDFSCKQGFINAIKLVMRLRPKGLCFLAPRCGPWMWLNVVKTRRCLQNQYWGDRVYNQEANESAIGCIILMELAEAREVEPVMENPVKSYIFHWPPFKIAMTKMKMVCAVTHRCSWDKKKKPRIWKKYRFIAKGTWIKAVVKPCRCGKVGHLRTSGVQVKDGKKKVTGIPSRLKESAAYPSSLGAAIFHAWQKRGEAKDEKNAAASKRTKRVTNSKKATRAAKPKKATRAPKPKKAARAAKPKKAARAAKPKKAARAAKPKKEKKANTRKATVHNEPSAKKSKVTKELKPSTQPVATAPAPSWLDPGIGDDVKRSQPIAAASSWLTPSVGILKALLQSDLTGLMQTEPRQAPG
ncbi:unnamed protein product [Cladocopium goreaui]|uniref:Uncharacterized protein n=1 Tax=Cladocopium goreaui TaxID=2562237 RepID=A0A9P1CAR3_9DINO|nr:unnamed protein product [Cladocopium goreaui]